MTNLKLEDILAARILIGRKIHKTPLLHSQKIDQILGCEVYFKAECFQKTGSFKARGASHFLANANPPSKKVTTYSSGNHGQALAWAAAAHDYEATIFMPEDASSAKQAAIKGYGGNIALAGFTSDDRYQACTKYAAQAEALIVPPYDHEWIIAGQGTLCLEVLEEMPQFDALLAPTGGGGLLSGNALALKSLRQNTNIYACEPELADDARQSIKRGSLTSITYPKTIADGARNLCLGDRNWNLIQRFVDDGLAAPEFMIISAMKKIATYLKVLVEPTGALGLACLMSHLDQFQGQRIVVVISGGNVSLETYSQLVAGQYAGSA